MKYNQFSN